MVPRPSPDLFCRLDSSPSPDCSSVQSKSKYCPYRTLRPRLSRLPQTQVRLLLQASSLELVCLDYDCAADDYSLSAVLHPAGNVAEYLVANGLARVVDWHAGMLSASGGMERLRAAERNAKEKRLNLYANATTPAVATGKPNAASNGHSREFDGIVIRVWSGDQISVADKDTGKERRLQLSSTRGPKLVAPVSHNGDPVDAYILLLDSRTRARLHMPKKPGNSSGKSLLESTSRFTSTSSVPARESTKNANAPPFGMETMERKSNSILP